MLGEAENVVFIQWLRLRRSIPQGRGAKNCGFVAGQSCHEDELRQHGAIGEDGVTWVGIRASQGSLIAAIVSSEPAPLLQASPMSRSRSGSRGRRLSGQGPRRTPPSRVRRSPATGKTERTDRLSERLDPDAVLSESGIQTDQPRNSTKVYSTKVYSTKVSRNAVLPSCKCLQSR
jgi:hypothetical protein